MKVIQYGPPRSGTTLICRIIIRLMSPNDEIVKTHSYLPEMNDCPPIITVRDIRDCIASQNRIDREIYYGEKPSIPFDYEKAKSLMMMTKYYLDSDFWPSIHVKGSLILKYEDFYKDIRGAIIAICKHLEIVPPDIDLMVKEVSIEETKKLIGNLPCQQFTTEWLHGKHITTPEPGFWKKAFAPQFHAEISDMFKEYLKKFGYDA